jgi:hypothetical protein
VKDGCRICELWFHYEGEFAVAEATTIRRDGAGLDVTGSPWSKR